MTPLNALSGPKGGTLRAVPGRGTTRRSIRVADDLWHAATARARRRGESIADVLRRALERYVSEGSDDDDPDSAG